MGGITSKSTDVTPRNTMSEPTENPREGRYLHYFPPYYIQCAIVGANELDNAKISWDLIVNNSSQAYLSLDNDSKAVHPTCIRWFSHTFYRRFFEVLPGSESLFRCRDVEAQGLIMVDFITTSLTQLRIDRQGWRKILEQLAKDHSRKGVVCGQYGLMGEVLFWSLAHCLGTEFTADMRDSWVKIYSLMLETIIPAAKMGEKRKSEVQMLLQECANLDFSESGDLGERPIVEVIRAPPRPRVVTTSHGHGGSGAGAGAGANPRLAM